MNDSKPVMADKEYVDDCGQTWKEVFTLTGWNPD